MSEGIASGALVEALVKRLTPKGAYRTALVKAGVDPSRVAPHYPAPVWDKVLRATRAYAFAKLDDQAAYREVGRTLIDGFLTTFTGRLLGAALPLMSPTSFLSKTPFYMRLGRSDVEVIVGPTTQPVRLSLMDPCNTSGYVSAGIIERCLERIGVEPRVEVEEVDPIRYHLLVRWMDRR